MRVAYKPIIESYEVNLNILDADYITIAIEADDVGNPQETPESRNFFQVIGDFIKKIIGILNRATLKIKNRLSKAMETNKGFDNALRKRQTSTKPLNFVEVVGYQYNHGELQSIYSKTVTGCIDALNKLVGSYQTNQDNDYTQMSADDLMSSIWSNAVGSECKSVNDYYTALQDKYRGEKKTMKIPASTLNNIIPFARGNAKIDSSTLTNNLNTMKGYTNKMDAGRKALQNADKEAQKKYLAGVKKANKIFAFADGLASYVHELDIESQLADRIIVKKFYQF